MNVAVIGAGWAGLAAAVAATTAGHAVTVYEASRSLGGRARSLPVRWRDGSTALLDNGQHILIGAYAQTLGLMRQVGVTPARVLRALPLALRFPDGGGLALPAWPAPLDAAWGIATARGWHWRDKASLLSTAARWRRSGFACPPAQTVAQLCRGLSPRAMADLIAPLCVSALNTPPGRASAQVFLRVIRDALFGPGHGGWSGSQLLLPLQDLGRLFPEAASHWLARHGARVTMGHRVHTLAAASAGWRVDDQAFDAVIMACPPWDAARLVEGIGEEAGPWLRRTLALEHEAITTVYATSERRLPLPFLALRGSADAPAQFVFDRGQLGGPAGLLAFVVSASQGDRDTLQRQVTAQARALGWHDVQPLLTVVEKRATFACTPGLQRPEPAIAPGLLACGDYVDGPYPATLEGAVRSALVAVARLGRVTSATRTARSGCPA